MAVNPYFFYFFNYLLSLINGEAVLLYDNRKRSLDPVFHQVNVHLTDAARKYQPKIRLPLRNANLRWAFDFNIARCLYFLPFLEQP